MSNRPLAYESLKTVIQYLDPNMRFLISTRIPSLQVVEKSVPLRIDKLDFSVDSFAVNGVEYFIGIQQIHPNNELSAHAKQIRDKGGWEYDVDVFGGPEHFLGDEVVLPGDVVLEQTTAGGYDFMGVATRNEEQLAKYISGLELELRSLERKKTRYQPTGLFIPFPVLLNSGEYREKMNEWRRSNPEGVKNTPEQLEYSQRWHYQDILERIADTRNDLHQLISRRDNIRPRFEMQLTISLPRGRLIERVEYTKKRYEAKKSLLNSLLGNRTRTVFVKSLIVDRYKKIRLPPGLKLKIRELKTNGCPKKAYLALKHVVEEDSYPLDQLEIRHSVIPQDINHEIVTNAKTLKVEVWSAKRAVQFFENLRNKIVHSVIDEIGFEMDYVEIIRSWLEVGRENGTCFTFVYKFKRQVVKVLKTVQRNFDDIVIGNKNVVIPMNHFSQLRVSYKSVEVDEKERWMLKLLVEPIQV